ncbi:uncharacterized protein BCR38DRAFT_444806 [Pseudomassariella vexata]|uniref:Uncharacterized protein n=1 Tax=Pseudomassariella vexata TaxID=1141098 RepID=A0A1Y2DK41_9PEZI|nr:uncharacterized protein BCR38DRAFT_444806 [Pseudomassariella vexata]ORY59534.1 hypothetical protein BCR38DRAFT_444806 [Pseudomassariella vexata]
MELQPACTPSFPAPPDPRLDLPVSKAQELGTGLGSIKAACEFSLREYFTLQNNRHYDDAVAEERFRTQRSIVLADLRMLRKDVGAVVKGSESHRWRRWILGGVVVSLIPAVRKIFRRSADDTESSNDTEYAFKRSKSLIERILDSVNGKGTFASVAFFVLAIMYVFQSEVSLRVARTVQKRLKRLSARIEAGDGMLGEADMDVFRGWRWRVLMWTE